jgi:adapter protein MecA 1/2
VIAMKIEKINDNKIKITLSVNDLQERDLNFDNLTYNSPQTQELFWDMMHQAEMEYGFSAYDCQLFIEAVPSPGETLIITVTKISADTDFESIHKFIKSKFKKSELRTKKKFKKAPVSLLIYSFDEFENLCSVSNAISNNHIEDSSLYKYKDSFYLMIHLKAPSAKVDSIDATAIEYGNKVSQPNLMEGILNEHGNVIIDSDAIGKLKEHFPQIN